MRKATAEPTQTQESETLEDARYTVALQAANVNRVFLRLRPDEASPEDFEAAWLVVRRAVRALEAARQSAQGKAFDVLDRAIGTLYALAGVVRYALDLTVAGGTERMKALDGAGWIANDLRHNPDLGGDIDLGHFDDV